jgi:Mn2+/Fe2+ NRAMP family transporter
MSVENTRLKRLVVKKQFKSWAFLIIASIAILFALLVVAPVSALTSATPIVTGHVTDAHVAAASTFSRVQGIGWALLLLLATFAIVLVFALSIESVRQRDTHTSHKNVQLAHQASPDDAHHMMGIEGVADISLLD